MKIVAAPNTFKGSLTAIDAARAIQKGIRAACPECNTVCIPIADGGDGFSEVITEALKGEMHEVIVQGPRLEHRHASSFGFIPATGVAIIEMAKASGLALLSPEMRDPTETSTYGTGELILAALDKGATRIVIGLGGSATCDGGIGMATALGYRFRDSEGAELPPIGKSLTHIHTIDIREIDSRLAHVEFVGVCDVTNPLYGKNGASVVYSPQKGASENQVRLLDTGLRNLADIIENDLGIQVGSLAGGGAAGGLGAGLHSFLGAKLEKGIDLIMDLVHLQHTLHDADLVITGEGQIDFQTKFDKAPAGVARLAKEAGVPCIAICGSVGENIHELYDIGLCAVFSICQSPLSLESAMTNSFDLLADKVEQVVRTFIAGRTSR